MSGPVIEPLSTVVERFERAYLVAALRAHGGSRVATARTLRVSRKTLWQKATRYEITEADVAVIDVPAPSTDTPRCARKHQAEEKAARAVLEAASAFAGELEAGGVDPDDGPAVTLYVAVKAWRAAQAAHATAAAEALAGVPS